MQLEPKMLKQRKQSLTKFQQGPSIVTGSNIVNSVTRQRQSNNGRIRSSSTLGKNYNQTGVLHLNNQSGLDRTQHTLGLSVQIKSNLHRPVSMKGADLVAWGQFGAGSGECPSQSRKLASNVVKYSLGQKHIVYINNKNEAYGIGSSLYGQLGYVQCAGSNDQSCLLNPNHLPILEQLLVQEAFCTPYCTFLITSRHEVYGCGLNNRGQLGSTTLAAISTPTKILSLSRRLLADTCGDNKSQKSTKKLKAPKIQSYALAERNIQNNLTQQSKLLTQKSQGANSDLYLPTVNSQAQHWMSGEQMQTEDETGLEDGQFITCMTGGPYHTIALSSKGRVFYSGNIYKKSAILNDEYTSKFAELNLKKIGKVHKIKSGLSCIGLLNMQGSLFLLGALNENIICDDPYNFGTNGIVDFGISKQKIYAITAVDVWVLTSFKKNLRTLKVNLSDHSLTLQRIQSIQCNLDYCLIMNEHGVLFGEGSNSFNLFGLDRFNKKSSGKVKNFQACQYQGPLLKTNCPLKLTQIKCGINFVLGLCGKFIPDPNITALTTKEQLKAGENKKLEVIQNETDDLCKKISELERQNKFLKDLIKDQNVESRSHRNGSIKNKDQVTTISEKQNQNQLTRKLGSNENVGSSKFNLNNNLGQKIVSKARKFDSSMEIPFEELELGKQISEGGYGVIYKASWRKTTVAVKIFKIDINSQNSIKDFISQCHAMEALRHPNIVMFLGACTKPPNFAIVLQYCQGGTLWSILQKNGQLSWELRRRFALDTARAMNYLHERSPPILHRDLKSLNLLLDENKRIKLADFGWTKGLQNYMTGKIGTYQWMAPEVVSSHQYTQKADVFSFGIILWEIASRQAPYRNIPGVQVAQDVLNKDLRPTLPKKTPQAFASLMKRCWGKLPDTRPSFSEIIEELQQMQLPV